MDLWIGILVFPLIILHTLGSDSHGNPSTPAECLEGTMKIEGNIGRYQYLRDLQNHNEDLFYSCLIHNVDKLLPVVYTPGVGEVCENYAKITGPKRGITFKITEPQKIEAEMREWKKLHPDVKAIVVTDGGRILGLGDLGANGMGIPVGKMVIYSALGGVHPQTCLPVTLDVGTDNVALRGSNVYVGLKQERTKEKAYNDFVEKFMTTAINVFGKKTLIQFEDFANKNAFKFLRDYRDRYTVFNDDIQGTAAVALAGILAAERFTNMKLKDSTILFAGAGEAGIGIANLMVAAMEEDGIKPETARRKIFLKRSEKLIMAGDDYPDPHDDRRLYLKSIPDDVPAGADIANLEEIIKWLKPNILIGVSAQKGIFTQKILETMAKFNDHPIIFPLSNPIDKSECTAKEAYEHTKGKVLFASGSPFDEVMVDGKTKRPQQCNNAYIFPGVALGITAAQMKTVPEKVFLIAAETLAYKCTQQEDFDNGSLFPRLDRLRDCSVEIATAIAKYAFRNNLSYMDAKDIPNDDEVRNFILTHQYKPSNL